MMTYAAVKENPSLFLALTSITCTEFESLKVHFDLVWTEDYRRRVLERPNRKRKPGAGNKITTLVSIEDKLLFILYYAKTYPLQEVLAYHFGMDQSTACDWIHRLMPLLREALKRGHYTPERLPDHLAAVLSEDSSSEYAIDGVERRRQRPQDPEIQQDCFSGKKKAHTLKNLVIGSLKTIKVNYLGMTHPGKTHDKRMADIEQITFPEGILLFMDLAFQGYAPTGVVVCIPEKKPRKRELTTFQKESNRLIARIRIVIEHIISGIKRCRIVKDTLRNTKEGFEDLVIEVACGLHNFRVDARHSPK